MDPWSSPWIDDNDAATAPPSLPQSHGADSAIAALPIDSSDLWSKDDSLQPAHNAPLPADDAAPRPSPSPQQGSTLKKLSSSLFATNSTPWSTDSAQNEPSQTPVVFIPESTTPTRRLPSLDFATPTAEADPWAATPQPPTAPSAAASSSSSFQSHAQAGLKGSADTPGWEKDTAPSSHVNVVPQLASPTRHFRSDDAAATTWSSTSQLSPDHRLPTLGTDSADSGELEDDVWTSAAAKRAQQGTRLSSDELDKLKVDARRMIPAVGDADVLASTFRMDPAGEQGWGSLFGAEGSKADVLRDLRQAPSASPSEAVASPGSAYGKAHHNSALAREAVRQTEGKGVKLTSSESSGFWKGRARAAPKPEWEADGAIPVHSAASAGGKVDDSSKSTEAESKGSAGPGWYQTTPKEARPASSGGLFASLFRGRQATTTSTPSPTISAGTSSPRASVDQARTESVEQPSVPLHASAMVTSISTPPSVMPAYSGPRGSQYTDDPSGPDLMQMGQPSDGAAAQLGSETRADESKPSILSRWKGRSLFGSARSSKPSTSGATGATGFSDDDFNWLDSRHPVSQAAYTDDGSYSHDDSYDNAFDDGSTSRDAIPGPRRNGRQVGSLLDAEEEDDRYDAPPPKASGTSLTSADLLGGIDSLGLAKKPLPRLSDASANPQQARQGENGMRPKASSATDWPDLDWDEPRKLPAKGNSTAVSGRPTTSPSTGANLARSVSLAMPTSYPAAARASPAISTPSPTLSQTSVRLPPPPLSHRVSLPPPPRAGKVAEPMAKPPSGLSTSDNLLFSDFETTPGDVASVATASAPPARSAPRLSQGNTLTADDLSFFDSL